MASPSLLLDSSGSCLLQGEETRQKDVDKMRKIVESGEEGFVEVLNYTRAGS